MNRIVPWAGVLLVAAGPLASPQGLAGQWRVEEQSVGEGIPGWIATAGTRDGSLEVWLELSCDGTCVRLVFLRSGGAFD